MRLKLSLLQSVASRPRYAAFANALTAPFYRNGEMPIRFSYAGKTFKVYIRKSDQESDCYSVMEIAVHRIYEHGLDPDFAPDLILDGGGNIGLFTLIASAAYPRAQLITCEPVPWNISQIEKHLALNGVGTDLRPVCIGGSPATIRFYCREANQSSFDPGKPYSSEMNVEVLPLADILQGDHQRLLIKLDIEGMEIVALESYVPVETRAVFIIGELHNHKENHAALERICCAHDWSLRFSGVSDAGSVFEAWSPAARPFVKIGPQ